MRAAYDAPSGERFHDWRKRVKYHRYHLELLAGLWPRQIGSRRKEVRALGGALGDEHDLAVLQATLAAADGGFGERSARAMIALAERRQAELRAAMRPLGERLFAEPPRALARWFEAYWRAAHSEAGDGRALELA
jgi:CHAD domain-containing protein